MFINDELVEYEEPIDLLYLRDDLERAIENRPPEYKEDNTLIEEVKSLYKFYCKKYFEDKQQKTQPHRDCEAVFCFTPSLQGRNHLTIRNSNPKTYMSIILSSKNQFFCCFFLSSLLY